MYMTSIPYSFEGDHLVESAITSGSFHAFVRDIGYACLCLMVLCVQAGVRACVHQVYYSTGVWKPRFPGRMDE